MSPLFSQRDCSTDPSVSPLLANSSVSQDPYCLKGEGPGEVIRDWQLPPPNPEKARGKVRESRSDKGTENWYRIIKGEREENNVRAVTNFAIRRNRRCRHPRKRASSPTPRRDAVVVVSEASYYYRRRPRGPFRNTGCSTEIKGKIDGRALRF